MVNSWSDDLDEKGVAQCHGFSSQYHGFHLGLARLGTAHKMMTLLTVLGFFVAIIPLISETHASSI